MARSLALLLFLILAFALLAARHAPPRPAPARGAAARPAVEGDRPLPPGWHIFKVDPRRLRESAEAARRAALGGAERRERPRGD